MLNCYIENGELRIEFDADFEEKEIEMVALQNLYNIVSEKLEEIEKEMEDSDLRQRIFLKESTQSFSSLIDN